MHKPVMGHMHKSHAMHRSSTAQASATPLCTGPYTATSDGSSRDLLNQRAGSSISLTRQEGGYAQHGKTPCALLLPILCATISHCSCATHWLFAVNSNKHLPLASVLTGISATTHKSCSCLDLTLSSRLLLQYFDLEGRKME